MKSLCWGTAAGTHHAESSESSTGFPLGVCYGVSMSHQLSVHHVIVLLLTWGQVHAQSVARQQLR